MYYALIATASLQTCTMAYLSLPKGVSNRANIEVEACIQLLEAIFGDHAKISLLG